jgi:hypothetical protein
MSGGSRWLSLRSGQFQAEINDPDTADLVKKIAGQLRPACLLRRRYCIHPDPHPPAYIVGYRTNTSVDSSAFTRLQMLSDAQLSALLLYAPVVVE